MRSLVLVLVATVLAGLGGIAPATATAPAVAAASAPKVAIIVGATHGVTATYRQDANEVAAEALKFTPNVVKVYSPNATWSKVKAAVNGASIIVYLGHGNGWPSPYTYDPNYTTKDGFGLNYDNNGDGKLSDYENRYYGEPSIRTLTPAPNAVVLLFHLCYASGNSEPGNAAPSLSVAKQRVDNYAAAFLKAGARAVIANGHSHNPYYINALFTTRQTIDQYWRNAPDFNGRVTSYASTRSPGYTFQMDPESSTGYYRSIAGKMSLTTTQVTGASYASTSGDPTTFQVPGKASTTQDAAPLFDTAEAAQAGTGWTDTIARDTLVSIDAGAAWTTWDGWPIFHVLVGDGRDGWMSGAVLRPRDAKPPAVWEVDAPDVFSPNGDGVQDGWDLAVRLSEPSAWELEMLDAGGSTVASWHGGDDTPTDQVAASWTPDAGSVPDGAYTWRLTATDPLGNAGDPYTGEVDVDTTPPDIALADADAATVPTFTPNGDGSRDTIGFAATSNEPGTFVARAIGADGTAVDSFSAGSGVTAATLTWDGRTTDGVLPDGRYTVSVRARDRAGNLSAAQSRDVGLYAALGSVAASKTLFFPVDNDAMSRSIALSFRLASPATVTWRIVNQANETVRTLKADEALGAGTYSAGWDGRNDQGKFVPRGTYRSFVAATNGEQSATQAASFMVEAFRIVASDSTPGRRQKITVTATSAEALGALPRLSVYQPGIAGWSATMSKVSAGVYRVTVTLRSSSTGTMRLKVTGVDSGRQTQLTNVYLPLH